MNEHNRKTSRQNIAIAICTCFAWDIWPANTLAQDAPDSSRPVMPLVQRIEILHATLQFPSEMVFNGECSLVRAEANLVCEENGWLLKEDQFDDKHYQPYSGGPRLSGKVRVLVDGSAGHRCVTTGLVARQVAIEITPLSILNINPHYRCNAAAQTYDSEVKFYRQADSAPP